MGMIGRVAGFPLVRIGIGLILVIVPVILVENLADLVTEIGYLARAVISALAALAGYALFVRWVERRVNLELAPAAAAREVPMGLLLGAAVFCLSIGSIWALGGVVFEGRNPAPDLSYAAAMAVMGGVVEELAIRGVVFRLLQGWLGSWVALGLSAALFGGLHLSNPGATPMAAVSIALEAGVMLAAAFMVTGRLWLPIGLHAGWNFTQAGVFGVAVSGNAAGGLWVSAPAGPDWLSGGDFGAEASVLAVLWCGILGMALLVIAGRSGRWVGTR